MVEIKFARLKRESENSKDSHVFFKGKKEKVINLDKTNGALDNTYG